MLTIRIFPESAIWPGLIGKDLFIPGSIPSTAESVMEFRRSGFRPDDSWSFHRITIKSETGALVTGRRSRCPLNN